MIRGYTVTIRIPFPGPTGQTPWRYFSRLSGKSLYTRKYLLLETPPKKFKYSWGIGATLDMIGGKGKPLVICQLRDGTLRFNQIVD